MTYRLFSADIAPSVHPLGISGEDIGQHYGIPSLSSEFPSLGGATSASFVRLSIVLTVYTHLFMLRKQIFDELNSIVHQTGGTAAPRGLQRLPIHRDMMSDANTEVRSTVWVFWIGE